MKQINKFSDKIISDLDPSAIGPNNLVFPTIGIRIFNKDGKGLIASTLPGNQEIFSLSDGFYCVGGCEYEGIAFIFSLNDITHEGEVGTYPTPNLTVTGFTKTYTPLQNLDGMMFRTPLFKFNKQFPVSVCIKKSYDDSYDIYFFDCFNTDKVINSGFKSTGLSNGRITKSSYFDGAINLDPISTVIPYNSNASVLAGGFLKPGNYYLYVRYLTADYASTNFLGEIGPLSVSAGDNTRNHEGKQEMVWTSNMENITDKKISLTLSNIDVNYAYVQIGVVRYSATTENGPAQPDVYYISNYYPISNLNSMLLTIYGNEAQGVLTMDEIIKPPLEYTSSRSQVELDNRLLRANMKKQSQDYDRNALIQFAYLCVVNEDNTTRVPNIPQKDISWWENPENFVQYDSSDNVYKYMGYFKGEIYPFACVFQFNNGTESEAFPVLGRIGSTTNTKGLYKFQSWLDIEGSVVHPTQGILSFLLFYTGAAVSYYLSNPTLFTGVKGFYFVRGERIKNMLYQGVMIRGFNGVLVNVYPEAGSDTPHSFQVPATEVSNTIFTSPYNIDEAATIPLIRGILPLTRENNAEGDFFYYAANEKGEYPGHNEGGGVQDSPCYTIPTHSGFHGSPQPQDHKHGVFSPDLLFQIGSLDVPEQTYIRPLFCIYDDRGDLRGYMGKRSGRYIYPSVDYIDITERAMEHCSLWWAPRVGQYLPADTTIVEHLQLKGKNNFTGYLPGADPNLGFVVQSKLFNRNIGTCRYIGIQDQGTFPMDSLFRGVNIPTYEILSIVDVCKYSSDSAYETATLNSFNPAITLYSKISDFIPINSSGLMSIKKGDCFLNKTWFRSHRWYAMERPANGQHYSSTGLGFGYNMVDGVGRWYQHGMMIGLTTEMQYNSGMRNNVIGVDANDLYREYTFFPKCMENLADADSFICIEPGNYAQEALQINAGYNKVASNKTNKGYEVTQPPYDQNKPNRVYASDKAISGSFLDGYRSTQIGSYQDYALEDGEIFVIKKNLNFPFLIQYSGINQIFLDERAMGQSEAGQDIILGASVAFLSDKVKKIGWFGTQHRFSVVDGTKGTYGFDFMQRVWWMINTMQTQNGYQVLQAKDLTEEHLIYNEIKAFLETYSQETDIASILPEDPLNGSGIVGFCDIENEEVGMTFLLPMGAAIPSPMGPTPIGVNNWTWSFRTFIFNEKLQGFRGNYPFTESFYMNLGSMLLSQHHYFGPNYEYLIGSKFYRYNISLIGTTPNYGKFFGVQEDTVLSFIVNGAGGKDATGEIMKIFNSLELESCHIVFKSITFETQYQKAVYDFTTIKFWESPEYLEHKWQVPILVQSSSSEDAFDQDSELIGKWMKVTIVYNGNEDIELKSVITDFDISIV